MPGIAPVLLAEDEAFDTFLLQRAFRVTGIRNPLVSVQDGQQAIWYLQGESPYRDRSQHPEPQLLLLDLKMPLVSGFEVLEWLQHEPELRERLPVVVLTSSDHDADMRKAFELGANDYLLKPTDFNALLIVVNELRQKWLEPHGEKRLQFASNAYLESKSG